MIEALPFNYLIGSGPDDDCADLSVIKKSRGGMAFASIDALGHKAETVRPM
jgi:hypothetical protein